MTFVDLQTYLEHISFFELVNVGVSLFHFIEIHGGTMKQPKYRVSTRSQGKFSKYFIVRVLTGPKKLFKIFMVRVFTRSRNIFNFFD